MQLKSYFLNTGILVMVFVSYFADRHYRGSHWTDNMLLLSYKSINPSLFQAWAHRTSNTEKNPTCVQFQSIGM